MRPDHSTRRYTRVAIILHWVMALGIAALAAIGLIMTHLKLEPMQLFQLYQLHKSIGITVLLAAFPPLTLPFTLVIDGRSAHAKGHVELNRHTFGIGQGPRATDQWVAFEVGVDIDVAATPGN